jgi:hypothetical protein
METVRTMSETTLPKRLPVLAAKDICRGYYDGPNGTHCLLGWARQWGEAGDAFIIPALSSQIHPGQRLIAMFNDDIDVPKSRVAAVWNRAAKSLGYVRRGSWWTLPKRGAR